MSTLLLRIWCQVEMKPSSSVLIIRHQLLTHLVFISNFDARYTLCEVNSLAQFRASSFNTKLKTAQLLLLLLIMLWSKGLFVEWAIINCVINACPDVNHADTAVPSSYIQLHHWRSPEADDPGVEQSRPLSSPTGHRMETLHDLSVPPPANSLLHLPPWTAL